MPPPPIRLTPADAERYARFRRRMLTAAPWAFGSSPDDDPAGTAERLAESLARTEYAIFAVEGAAESGGERPLVAAAGVLRNTRRKFAHRAGIWGVYVEPEHRGAGLGRAVVEAAIEVARGWAGVDYVDLAVSENAPEALRLYQSLGFVAWGREPEATEVDGQRYDEIHMTLRL